MQNFINLNPNWITGFADGESTFGINVSKNSTHKLGYQVRVWFAISQDQRDVEVLKSLKNYFNVGSIYKDSGERTVWIYKVSSHLDIYNNIIPFFDK